MKKFDVGFDFLDLFPARAFFLAFIAVGETHLVGERDLDLAQSAVKFPEPAAEYEDKREPLKRGHLSSSFQFPPPNHLTP